MWLVAFRIFAVLVELVGPLVARVLVSLGIGFVTFTGVNTSLGWAKAQFLAGVAGMPAVSVQLAGTMKVGVCVSMLLSAVAARLLLAGLSAGAGGSITRMVTK